MNHRKKVLLCGLLALVLTVSLLGCGQPDPTVSTTVPAQAPTQELTEPTTQLPTVTPIQPSTTVPVTNPATQPTTVPTQPAVTEPVTQPAQPPVTEPPVTESPTTEPPATVPAQPPTTEPSTTAPPATEPKPELNYVPLDVTVSAPGTLVKQNEKATIDYSNTKDGYVMVCYTASTDKRLKAQVAGSTTTYTYNLTPGKWAAFPLSDQNGTYKITVYQNVEGNSYAAVVSATVENVTMTDEFAPFIRSNQFVNFDEAPNSKKKAWELTAGISDPLKKVEKIYDFVVTGMCYDYDLANSVQSGYVPDMDSVLQKMKGICFDYAALMAGMLRSQGVPTKLVVGYAGDVYHAWISVWTEDSGWIDGVIFFDGSSWHRLDPTFASTGGSGGAILDYIGNGANYSAKYFY